MKLFKYLLALLLYLFATLIWFSEAVPVIFDNPSDLELIGGVFGICLWMIVTAALVIVIIQTPRNSAPEPEDPDNFPEADDSMHIDDRVRMAANARRYEWLRDRGRVTDLDTDLCVARDDTVYFGHDLDRSVDDAMRLAYLEELHPCAG